MALLLPNCLAPSYPTLPVTLGQQPHWPPFLLSHSLHIRWESWATHLLLRTCSVALATNSCYPLPQNFLFSSSLPRSFYSTSLWTVHEDTPSLEVKPRNSVLFLSLPVELFPSSSFWVLSPGRRLCPRLPREQWSSPRSLIGVDQTLPAWRLLRPMP